MKTLENFNSVQLSISKLKSITGGSATMEHCNRETGNPLTDRCVDTVSTTSSDDGKVLASGTAVCCH